jgi:hypothetical protein
MSSKDIKHFLVIYDIPRAEAHVERFENDYEAAVAAYNEAEHEHRDDPDVEVVLLGSDSIDTLERTHSSYFELREKHVDHVVAQELAELGLR